MGSRSIITYMGERLMLPLFKEDKTMTKVRATEVLVKEYDGKLPAVSWVGGYRLMYFNEMGEVFCSECANKRFQDEPLYYEVYDEGPMLHCEDCNAELESNYGDPDEDNNS